MAKDKTDYLLRQLDTGLWHTFVGICKIKGKSARSVLIELVEKYVKDHRGSSL